ncbi:M20/M25/M40 family metallo-hydrolase [Erythrobacter sp.]|uniref:M20/M25/M40 family metallo-hydrolase n=1 Tax=Erythrobacter sp. TaxID=1042 RepID=UPI001425D2CA|nr:M20/M25/M40 family metallo-hydrolase [Erythrobacter sp.]QIQ85916.1 MAG: M20/M25/M40 family metallo-hydrolase [Erythrobacter sp.]
MSLPVRLLRLAAALFGLAALAACASAPPPAPLVSDAEIAAIRANLTRDIAVLASDEFGGRKPGTPGEAKTVDFLIGQLEAAGLVSGTNDPGSAWRAPVDLIATSPQASGLSFEIGERGVLIPDEEGAAFTTRRRVLVQAGPDLGSEVVFVGRESDSITREVAAGQILVMLGEPGVSPQRRAALFALDPVGIVTVVEDEKSIAATRRAYGRERLLLASEEEVRLSAFVTAGAMERVLGKEAWRALEKGADEPGFEPVTIPARLTIEATSKRREFASSNVIGLLPGTKPEAGAVLLLGHWDHLGECGEAPDPICNGAVDNASGIAALLELARRLAASGPHERDIYVLATSAEEAGLLGAKAFAENPPLPLDAIIAAFNFDTVAVAPAGTPVGFIGAGRTPLDKPVLDLLAERGRTTGDPAFAEAFLRRQDGWALLEKGVPAVLVSSAFASRDVLGSYLRSDYHRPSDEPGALELGGAIEDLLLHEELVRRLADTTLTPSLGPAIAPSAPEIAADRR